MRGLWLLIFVLLPWFAVAQINLGTPPAAAPVPSELANPRSALTTYFNAMERGNLEGAAKVLDLSDYPAIVRQVEGRRVATLLLAVLNRTQNIELAGVTDSPTSASPLTVATLRHPRTQALLGDLQMVRSSAGWQISAGSLARLPAWWQEVQDQPVLRGLREVSESDFLPEKNLKRLAPEAWQRVSFLGLALWQWIFLAALLAAAGVLSFLIFVCARPLLVRWRGPDESEDWKKANRSLRRSGTAIVFLTLVRSGWAWLGFPVAVDALVYIAFALLMAWAWVVFLFALLDVFLFTVARRSNSREERTRKIVVPVVGKLGRFFLAAGIVLLLLSQLGLNVWGVIAGLGIGGLVVALAAKDSIENLFGSVTILLDMPFGIGDWVKIGDLEGEVEEINLRSTRIRTFADSILVLPNSRLITASVENMGLRRYRRFRTSLTLSASGTVADVEAFCEAARALLANRSDLAQDKTHLRLSDFSETGLVVLIVCYLDVPDYLSEVSAREAIIGDLLRLLDTHHLSHAALDRRVDPHARP